MEITNAKNKTGKIACCNKEKNGIKNHHYCHFKTKITVITEIADNIVGK